MKQEVKILLIVGIITAAILAGAVFLLSGNSGSNTSGTKIDSNILVKNDSYRIGSESAKVTLVEFGDYQCPACGAAYPVIKALTSNYQNKISFVFRNYAFLGQESILAAQAAQCAGEQGKFWDYHDYLYEHQGGENNGTFSKDNLKNFAKTLNLDTSKFNACLDSGKYAAKVTSDTSDGGKAGVNSTPTFFINGQKEVGVPNYNDFKSKIDALLK